MNLHCGLGSCLRTKYSVIAFLLRGGGHTPPPGPFRVKKVKKLKNGYWTLVTGHYNKSASE